MKRILPLAALAAGLAAALCGPALAQQPTPPPAEPAQPAEPAPSVRLVEPADLGRPLVPSGPAPAFQKAALMAEIRAALEAGRAEIAELEAGLDPAAGGEAFLDLQRRIEARKERLQREVLEIQLQHAERAGRAESAARLRRALEARGEAAEEAAPVLRDRDEGRAP